MASYNVVGLKALTYPCNGLGQPIVLKIGRHEPEISEIGRLIRELGRTGKKTHFKGQLLQKTT